MLEYHLMTTSHYSSLKLFSNKLRHSGFLNFQDDLSQFV